MSYKLKYKKLNMFKIIVVYSAAKHPCRNFPIKYGFIERLFFEAILKIWRNIENPANPSKNAHVIIW